MNSFAAEFKLEPIYSSERTQRLSPKPVKTVTNFYVGMRALYGVPLFSVELELAQANRAEEFPDESRKIDFTTQRAMLGFRSYPIRSKFFGFYLRGGARARKEIQDIKENDIKTRVEGEIDYDPYAGLGFTLAFGDSFALNAGSTLVYNKNAQNQDSQYDTVNTLSFTMKTGNK